MTNNKKLDELYKRLAIEFKRKRRINKQKFIIIDKKRIIAIKKQLFTDN